MFEALGSTFGAVLGFVVVVLILSLILQAVQNLIKKALRMKSRQVEHGLRLLFDYAITAGDATKNEEGAVKTAYASPLLDICLDRKSNSRGQNVVEAIREEMAKLGRKSLWGRAILDSITKEDLKLILSRVKPGKLGVATAVGEAGEKEVAKTVASMVRQVEEWYDTVMPGIAERYERGMKWLSLLLAAALVILLNANAFTIYVHVASDKAVQQRLELYAKDWLPTEATVGQPGPGTVPQPPAAKPAPQGNAVEGGQPTPTNGEHTKTEIDQIQALLAVYRDFGFAPLSEKAIKANFGSWSAAGYTLLGWLAMTLLLSLGAPFWEDALESVFSLKNVLRKTGAGKV